MIGAGVGEGDVVGDILPPLGCLLVGGLGQGQVAARIVIEVQAGDALINQRHIVAVYGRDLGPSGL